MNLKVLEALQNFRDFMYCATGDFYFLHHIMCGINFDSLHEILQKYYEEAAGDFDNLSEWLLGMGMPELNVNGAAKRIDYLPLETDNFHRDEKDVVAVSDHILNQIVTGLFIIYKAVDAEENGLMCGLAAELQGRLTYWGKEYCYFNARRMNSDGEVKQREHNAAGRADSGSGGSDTESSK